MSRRLALPLLIGTAALTVATAGSALAGHAAFSDTAGSPHEAGIHWLADTGITGGCGNGQFCPNDGVRRGQMATFLHRLSGTSSTPPVVNADKVDGLDAAQLRGSTGPAGPAGPPGPADSDVFYTVSDLVVDGLGAAFCDPGDIAVSGGFVQDEGVPHFVVGDFLVFDETTESEGWLVAFTDETGTLAGTGSVDANCQVADTQTASAQSLQAGEPSRGRLQELYEAGPQERRSR